MVMSWFRKERPPLSTVDMPLPMARSATQPANDPTRADAAAANAQIQLDARRAADERRAAALERATRRDDTEVEDAVVKTERRDDAPAQQREDMQARQRDDAQVLRRDDAQALRRDDAQASPRDDLPTQPGGDTQTQRPGDAHAPSMNDDQQLPPLFSAEVAQTFRARWDAAQISFVDDPRQAVEQADELVAQMIKSLAHSVANERARMDAQLHEAGTTENLRVALQRYRAFFQRLLTL